MKTQIATIRQALRKIVPALLCATVIAGSAASPALADGWGHHHGRGGWRDGGWREHEWRGHDRYYVVPPRYVYAPPPRVVYAPPPRVVYEPAPVYVAPPSLNIVIPIR